MLYDLHFNRWSCYACIVILGPNFYLPNISVFLFYFAIIVHFFFSISVWMLIPQARLHLCIVCNLIIIEKKQHEPIVLKKVFIIKIFLVCWGASCLPNMSFAHTSVISLKQTRVDSSYTIQTNFGVAWIKVVVDWSKIGWQKWVNPILRARLDHSFRDRLVLHP